MTNHADEEKRLNEIAIRKMTSAPSKPRDPINLPQLIELLRAEELVVRTEAISVGEKSLIPHYSYDNLRDFACWTLWQMNLSMRVEGGEIVISTRQDSDHDYYWNTLGCTFLWTPDSNEKFKSNDEP